MYNIPAGTNNMFQTHPNRYVVLYKLIYRDELSTLFFNTGDIRTFITMPPFPSWKTTFSAIDFINQFCRSQRGPYVHFFTFTNYTQWKIVVIMNLRFRHWNTMCRNKLEKIGQKAMMSSTSIFVNVDVTPGQRKVTTDDPSLNWNGIIPLSVPYSQCIPVCLLCDKKMMLDSTYKTVDSSNEFYSSWKNGTTLDTTHCCKTKGCEVGMVITPGPNSEANNPPVGNYWPTPLYL